MQEEYTYIDKLTGVYNRHYLKEQQEEEINVLITKKIPCSVVIVDIDRFKAINDTYGHIKGDEVIKGFAQFMSDALRQSDKVIRYGGDEFVCIMPGTARQDAEEIYRRILRQCREREFGGLRITLSAGVSAFPDDGYDLAELLRIADQTLYEAKRSGGGLLGVTHKKRIELPMKVFIGRIAEKEVLGRLLVNDTKRMCVVVVKGNIGIGKTRLGKQVLSNVRDKELVWSDCLLLTETIAYYPIRETLKHQIKRWGIEVLKDLPLVYRLEISKLIPELSEQITKKPHGVELVLDKYRLYEGVRKVMEIGRREKIVVIDNVQWIDRESTEVIKYLMRSLKDNPIAFVFIYRVEEMTVILEEFLSYISREIDVMEIQLNPFTYSEIKGSVSAIIGEEPEKRLTDYVAQESGGIPFYIEEIMRELLNTRYLTIEEDTWVYREPDTEIVPKSLQDITMRKYQSLSKEAQQVLDIASVAGWFDVEIISEITGYNEGEVTGLINDIGKLRMMKYAKDRFEFAEEISRQALYKKNLEGTNAITLHREVAEKLEKRNKSKKVDATEELAFHYYRSKERTKGVRYCLAAGDRAKEQYANREAIKYYAWTLELLADEYDEERVKTGIDCLYKKAEILSLIGDYEIALRDLDIGLKKSEALGDEKRLADLLLKKACVHYDISCYRQAISEAEKCRAIYEKIGKRKDLAQVLNVIGLAYSRLTDDERALEFHAEALKMFRESGEKKGEAAALSNIGLICLGSDYPRALKCFEDALEIHKEVRDRVGEAKTCSNIGIIYSQLGDHQKALCHYEDALKIHRDIGNRQGEATTCGNIGLVYDSLLGDHHNALKHNEASLKIRREIGDKRGEAIGLADVSLMHVRSGDYKSALMYSQSALEIAREIGDRSIEAYVLNEQGYIYQYMGDYNNAGVSYEKSRKIIDQININRLKFENLFSLGELRLALDDIEGAKSNFSAAYTVAKEANSKDMLFTSLSLLAGCYIDEEDFEEFTQTMQKIADSGKEVHTKRQSLTENILWGRYYTKIRDFSKAETRLKEALEIAESLGEKLSIGRVFYRLADMELTQGHRIRAKRYFDQSLRTFDSIDARGWKKTVEEYMKKHNLE